MRAPFLIILLLLVACFAMAAALEPRFQSWSGSRAQSDNLLAVVMGDSRKLFANHFFIKADAYFHSGFYPSIFHNREAFQTAHMAEDAGALEGKNEGDEHDFMGKPRDWIERFGRSFFPSVHTHLDQGGAPGHDHDPNHPVELSESGTVREILPWLRLSVELDPHRVETYTVTAYWLRTNLKKADEAERFLREGLRANPDSFEILFELGRIYSENRNDVARARNLWELALRRWREQEPQKREPNTFALLQISSSLAQLEEKENNFQQALAYLQIWKSVSPHPEEIEKRLAGVRRQLKAP